MEVQKGQIFLPLIIEVVGVSLLYMPRAVNFETNIQFSQACKLKLKTNAKIHLLVSRL